MHWTRARSAPATLPAIALASTVFAVRDVLERDVALACGGREDGPTSSRLPWITVSTLSSRQVAAAVLGEQTGAPSGACPLSVLAVSVEHSLPRHDLLETTSSVVVKRTPRSRRVGMRPPARPTAPRAASSTKATA